jgi:deoxycytidylate deaminase
MDVPNIKFIKIAIREAAKSDHRQHHMAAVLIKGGNIISVGHNSGHLHGEHTCLNRAWRTDVSGSTVLVVRVRRNGTLGMAKPCPLCMQRLVQAGIKKVTYSTNSGTFETMKLSSMSSNIGYLEYHFVGANHQGAP